MFKNRLKLLSVVLMGVFLALIIIPTKASTTLVNTWAIDTLQVSTVTIPVSPNPGDLVVAFLYTYKSTGCVNVTAVPTQFTSSEAIPIGTPACQGSRNEAYIYTHIAGSGETSYNWTTDSPAYMDVIVYDLAGANTANPVDNFTSYVPLTLALSATAPSATANGNDFAISFFANGQARSTGIAAPYTSVSANNGVYLTTAYQSGVSGTVTGATSTFGSAPTSGIMGTLLISSAPSAVYTNSLTTANAGGPHLSIPVGVSSVSPSPAPTAPPLRDEMSWIGELAGEGVNSNMTATQAQINQYDDLCIGPAANSNNIWPTGCPGPGQWGFANGWVNYMEAGNGQPNTSGHDVDFPYNGSYVNNGSNTCNPAAKIVSGQFWNQQTSESLNGSTYNVPDYTSTGSNNWFIYVNGGTTGNANYMGAGWTGSHYYFYINLASPSVLAYANDVIANCKQNTNSSTQPFDSIGAVFHDNMYIGFQSGTWDKWDRYPEGKNFGTGTIGSPYGDPSFTGSTFSPSGFFNGTAHTRTTLITGNDTPITYPLDTSYRTYQVAYLGGLKHGDGSQMNVIYNGMLNTAQDLNKNSNTRFGVAEELLVGCFGACPSPQPLPYNGPTQAEAKSALNADLGMHSVINNAASMYQQVLKTNVNNEVSMMLLTDQTNKNIDGTTMLGTGIHQQNQLWGYAPIFGMFNDAYPNIMSAFNDQCGFGSSSLSPNCMDTWPLDFIMPSGRITPMPGDTTGASGVQPCGEYSGYHYEGSNTQCTTNGSYDSNILCGGITGLYCFGFSHLWAYVITGSGSCASYDRRNWLICAQDIGPFALIINGSGSSTTISTANLTSWFPIIHASLGHVLVPCTPLSSYWGSGTSSPIYAMPQSGTLGYGTGVICSGNTGQDVPNGGTWDTSHALSTITSNNQLLYDGQALYLVP